MKKVLFIFICAFLITSCDKDNGGSSNTSYRAKPGGLTAFNSPATRFSTNLDTDLNGYAIIYNGPINGTNYVGIALSSNPDATPSIKIYYQSNTISNISLIGGTSPGFKVIHNGIDITGTGTIYDITYVKSTNGSFTTYTITISGAGASVTTSPDIYAIYAGTNP
jgi:hypothetical protein